jgi:LPXTG-site transpeptidase (sortase) family protein
MGGNAVFAGHVDSGFKPCHNGTVKPPCEAVLWDLNKLANGDEIDVTVSGVTYQYSVASNQPVSDEGGDWASILASTPQEQITIITCGGDFNPQTHNYDKRQVVTAVRLPS